MAKGKKKRSRQGLFSKAINIGLIALGFSRVLKHLLSGAGFDLIQTAIIREATFGLSDGKFDMDAGLAMYTPVGAAIGLGKLKQYLMRHFPVR